MFGKLPVRFGIIARIVEDLMLLLSLLKDYWKGKYREVSLPSILILVVAVVYLLSPFDFVSDFFPVLGIVDDMVLIVACLYFLEKDLYKYRRWKNKRIDR